MNNGPATALVVGAAGGIGGAVLARFLDDSAFDRVVAVSRSAQNVDVGPAGGKLQWLACDSSEEAIAACCGVMAALDIRRVVICSGVLHDGELQPEKALEQVSRKSMLRVLDTNTVVPALWLAGLVEPLRRSSGCVVAVLSARVGSIADNRLGGWYSYRASKAALNMVLQTAAVEYRRRARRVRLLAFHPGTTDTPLSVPFQRNVPEDKLFTPAFVAAQLLQIMDEREGEGEVEFVDWAGKAVPW